MQNLRNLRNLRFNTFMAIALTLLLAGIIVQVTDYFEFFGHNSVIPLIIGLTIIAIGIPIMLIVGRFVSRKEKKKEVKVK